MPKRKIKLEDIYIIFVYIIPAVLYFSYWPWISFGGYETTNLDLSLPLIWLVLFDILSFVLIIKKRLFGKIIKKWVWLLFPIFSTLSLLWTHDLLRGVLVVGVLWLLYFAIISFMIFKKNLTGEKFWRAFLKVFFGVGIFVCGWCLLQCILDVAGVLRSDTLLCSGCVYKIFGFPHPNGFAAEPQFMGNLLLAPIFVSLYLVLKNQFFSRKSLLIMFFIFVATLFLTLSRGAIYAFIVAMVLFTVVWAIKTKKCQVFLAWLLILLAFLFTLNLQGIFAEFSKTDDTYISGVTKVINQLTLGKIDLSNSQSRKDVQAQDEFEEAVVEKIEDNWEDGADETAKEDALFDGYVEVSTSGRLTMWKAAIETWSKTPQNILFGVGIGGEVISVYESGSFERVGEIINNEYISVLLEFGLCGVGLLLLTLILIFKSMARNKNKTLLFTLVLAYMVSMLFFSGLPNALHIYLLPSLFMLIDNKNI